MAKPSQQNSKDLQYIQNVFVIQCLMRFYKQAHIIDSYIHKPVYIYPKQETHYIEMLVCFKETRFLRFCYLKWERLAVGEKSSLAHATVGTITESNPSLHLLNTKQVIHR